ncbi:hypothetical protein F2B00_32675 [Streptomyces parvus]|uniref:hypothetical protein n=1 Tax=Streptomyces parvus TaxID=66428 RepID=UPI00123B4B54|nr:hypothetical protein [Streptomyces parvus]KAA6198136.1 hypothetical protein F2B00_32675 [Streptomyces parvus]GGS57729.1 hypothetical protein GCM10010221_65880 [Streptomyces parvus]
MLSYEDIVEAPLGKLKAAADDWSEMATKLDRLADHASDGMKAKANKANWEGLNAGVTKAFVGKTVKEFADAAAEAKGVKTLLEEGYAAFKKAKDDLVNIRDHEGPAAGISVDGRGKVTARSPISENNAARHDPDFGKYLQQERENIASWQKKIDHIVETCNDTDVAFKNSLEANVTDRKDFSAPKYTKFDQEEAARAVALAAKGRDLTHAELQALNELLRENGKSVEFAKNFYEKLGPEKALTFFGQLATDTHDITKVDKERLADVQALQRNLGLNLATASHDKAFTAEWGPELRKMGTERFPLAKNDYGGPFGYQLLGGIMRFGNYDPKFLNPMAEHVVQLRQKDHDFFYASKGVPGGPENLYNPSGVNGSGYDPVNSMLEALGHSPEAAKQFFSAEPTAYNEDGTLKSGDADLGKDKEGEKITGYLDFFQNEDYDPFLDITSHHPDDVKRSTQYMPDALGKALEAATTGHAWDDPSPTLKRDEVTAGIMKNVIDSYGADSGLRDRHEPMKDSLARMGAAYIDDLNYSTYNFGGYGDEAGRDELFVRPNGSERNDFGEDATLRFMTAVAADDEGYRTLSSAQQVYQASGLRSFGENTEEALAFGGNATKVHGILDESRSVGIRDEFANDEDAKNLAMEKSAEWRKAGVSGAVTAVVGVGSAVVLGPAAGVVAAVAVPLAMEAAGSAVNTQYGTETLEYLKESEYNNDDQALTSIESESTQGERSAAAAMFHYADSAGMSKDEKRDLFRDIEQNYNSGVTAVGRSMKVK